MKVPITSMPAEAKIWVYQAGRILNESEVKQLEKTITSFLENWESHGNPLKAAWSIEHNQFIVLAVDSEFYIPSGCSIDKSVRMLQELEHQFGVSFLDKSKVAIEVSESEIKTYGLSELKEKIAEGRITKNTLIFNNLVNTVEDWQQNWKIPASQSWMSRYFSN